MVGLAPVKQQVMDLAAAAEIDADRKAQGLPVGDKTMHLVFTGAPGTGKTSVARQIGQLYYHMGLVNKDPSTDDGWIETSRAQMVQEYSGQTAKNVMRLFEGNEETGKPGYAGGVIFIDEAYSLYQGPQDLYGQEAVDELLRQAWNHRNDTVVILAGYTPQISEMFANANPGLRRRFPTTLEFPEMELEDRYEVMSSLLKDGKYYIGSGTKAEAVRHGVMDALSYTGAGNAGDVTNLFEKIEMAQRVRLANLKAGAKRDLTKRELSTITPGDVKAGMSQYISTANVDAPLRGRLVPTSRTKAVKKTPKKRTLKAVS